MTETIDLHQVRQHAARLVAAHGVQGAISICNQVLFDEMIGTHEKSYYWELKSVLISYQYPKKEVRRQHQTWGQSHLDDDLEA